MQTHRLALEVFRCCWGIFCIVWLLAAFRTKRSVYRQSAAQRLRYIIPMLLGGYLIFKGSRLPGSLGHRVVPQSDTLALIGIVLSIAGLAICLWARFTLGRNWSGVVTLKGEHELITRGPYAWVRHPIYTGMLFMLLANVVVLGHDAGMVGFVFVFVSFWIKLHYEESLMLQHFPDQYPGYQQRVRRLIPFVL